MKILQNETSTAAPPNTNDTEKEKFQQQPQQQQHQISEKRKPKTLKNKILQNVAQQQHQQLCQQNVATTAATVAMTDELSSTSIQSSIKTNINSSRNTTKESDRKLLKDSTSNSNNIKDNGQNNNNNNSSSDLIIAEAAKILLKNGLNGTNAAAAAAVATSLLTAAANFQLPHQQHSSSTAGLLPNSSSSDSQSSALAANSTTAAAAAHAQLVAIAAAAAAVNATNHKRLTNTFTALNNSASCSFNNSLNPSKSPQNQAVNNGLGSISPTSSPPSIAQTTPTSKPDTASSETAQFAKPFKATTTHHSANNTYSAPTTMSALSSMDTGIIDYTINNSSSLTTFSSSTHIPYSSATSSSVINLSTSASNNQNQKLTNSTTNSSSNSHLNRSDVGSRPPISHSSTTNNHNHNNAANSGGVGGFGGRLQFFKDGKFILELARSKDNEKGGWVSVPRKVFRTPSAATSSTVTPSATASTSAAIIPPSTLPTSPAAVHSAVVGAGANGAPYPKNDCSNSLSFSDDNSSLQSSPWQRDHCWKQAAPRKNISKGMALFYHKPACRKLTAKAQLVTQKKRRKPYDVKTIATNVLIFERNKTKEQDQVVDVDKSQQDVEVETKAEHKDDKKIVSEEMVQQAIGNIKAEIDSDGAKADDNSAPSDESKDVEMTQLAHIKYENKNKDDERNKQDEVEKMNTSDCDVKMETSQKSSSLNGNVANEDFQKQVPGTTTTTPTAKLEECINKGEEEKRLKKPGNIKTRAKLTNIVQKLMDASASRLAATAHSFKNSTQNPSAAATALFTSSNNNLSGVGGAKSNQNSKVSPPSNTAASRLVEYHQQHVSPRKRILREFEKVSLEDNATAAGGKRSRAKANAHSISHSQAQPGGMSKTPTTAGASVANSNASNLSKPNVVTSTAPTKLYSSYSIHSLLGGGSSSNSVSPSSSKKSSDIPATITSNAAYSPYHSSSVTHNAHQSPKSPDCNATGGGKSPSRSASKLKRSPPYSSPLRDTHSRSPTTSIGASGGITGYDYGRRSPRSSIPEVYNKMKYTGTTENSGSPHHHQQHYTHHQSAPQTYYSPYMTSPHYVPPPPLPAASALSPSISASAAASTSNSTSSSRSPRHHTSAFRATTPTSSNTALGGTNSNQHNIPSTQRGDLSPQRSTTASPRETTPRTVPKKTASIRRQFASPTSVNNTTTTTNHNSSCSSPTTALETRSEDNGRRTPVSHQQPHLLQRASPSSVNLQGSSPHPYAAYLYGPGASSPHPASAISPNSANHSAAVAAAAAASYIPAVVGSPYYHPYITTLAAMRHPQMWMQHYQTAAATNPALLQASRQHPAMLSAAAAGAAAARLSPPYHQYQYNGVSNAAALAAAAAAAGFGSAAAPHHHHSGSALGPPPGSMFNHMIHGMAAHPGALHAAGLVPAAVAALGSSHSMTDTTNDLLKASKNNNFSTSSSSSLASSSPLSGTAVAGMAVPTSTSGSHNSAYPTSNKDEQSSDVPLNLSKH